MIRKIIVMHVLDFNVVKAVVCIRAVHRPFTGHVLNRKKEHPQKQNPVMAVSDSLNYYKKRRKQLNLMSRVLYKTTLTGKNAAFMLFNVQYNKKSKNRM
jgi:tRNA uridine 5-carbamoylmethylation protein Kti12